MSTRTWVVALLVFVNGAAASADGVVRVSDFLPEKYVRDGSVSYQKEVQAAIDAAAPGGTVVFAPMTYAVDEIGWTLRSGLTLDLTGAVFQLGADCTRDGAVFHGADVTDLTLRGGEVIGRNDVWPDGVNIRGVWIRGRSARIRIDGMRFRDLSSNGVGVFGAENRFLRDVWVRDVVVENCCKRYPDYLSGERHEPGSVREDQGDVAFYFVKDFVVSGCRFERSRSDGTHFYRCRRGQISDNRIYRAKMGGFFLETCESVIGRGNVMLENGSRGATIERDSRNCVFADNVVRASGREGLWAPDCAGLVVTGNIFDRNGRKPNGPEKNHIWNANITINEQAGDPTGAPTEDYVVAGNLIYTTADQIAAVRIDTTSEETRNIVIQNNLLAGENRKLLIEGGHADAVTQSGNTGAAVEQKSEAERAKDAVR